MARFIYRHSSLIAQLLICVILLPFACFLVSLVIPDEGAGLLFSTVGELPLIGIFFGMMGQFSSAAALGGEQSLLVILDAVVTAANSEFESAVILGMCIYALKRLALLIDENMRGPALLPTVAGVLAGSVLLRYIRLDATARLTTMVFLVSLCALMAIFSTEKSFLGKVVTVFFGLALQAVIAAAAGAYACVLFYIAAGGAGGGSAAGLVFTLQLFALVTGILLILLVLDAFLELL